MSCRGRTRRRDDSTPSCGGAKVGAPVRGGVVGSTPGFGPGSGGSNPPPGTSVLAKPNRLPLQLVAIDHAVDEPVLGGFFGIEVVVALHVVVDALGVLAAVPDVDRLDPLAQ